MFLFVGGGAIPAIRLLPMEDREPTLDIVCEPMRPDEASVTDAITFAHSDSTSKSQAQESVALPENRPHGTPIERRLPDELGPQKLANSSPEKGKSVSLPPPPPRRAAKTDEPINDSAAVFFPASVGQTGAESKMTPVKIHNPKPTFPVAAIGKSGSVYLIIVVSPDGTVGDVSIDQSSGVTEFDDAAITAVKGWRFLAAIDPATGTRKCRQRIDFLLP